MEILQVVAFCQKTGHLTVRTPRGEAAVVFREGRVVAGHIWDVPHLGPEELSLSPDAREETIRRRITSTLLRLVRLREGEFGFNVSTEAPARLGERDLTAETLEEGINPEGLMLDLARQMDEDRRDTAAALGASFAAPEPGPAPEEELEELVLEDQPDRRPLVLLVDDEPDVRRLVGAQLVAHGFEVVAAADAAAARLAVTRLTAERRRYLVVTDLGIPSLGGNSFRGGFDVVRHANALEPRPRILLMVDRADEKLRSRARRLGASFLAFKPGLSKLDPLQYAADLRAFGDRLARDLLPRLLRRAVTRTPAPVLSLPADESGAAPPASDREAARSAVVRSALDELAGQPEPDVVAFLLLRAARAFLPRAILFLVRDDRLWGLAGFGETESEQSLDLRARVLSVSLDDPSPFADAVACGRAWRGVVPDDGPLSDLLDHIGVLETTSAAVVPVRAHRETVAVLYGDSPGGRPLPDISALVDLVERAGRALDETFLARRAAASTAA